MQATRILALTGLLQGLAWPALAADEALPEAIRALEARGAKVTGQFAAPGGLKGYAAEYQGQGMAFYLTPDGQHALIGTLFDQRGQDLTAAPLEQLVYAPMASRMWQQLESARWLADGRADAPRTVYVFSDPNCPYCAHFWHQARPWVDSGKVQLRHLLVGILREDSPGKAAAILASADPARAWLAHEQHHPDAALKPVTPLPAGPARQLDDNLQLMETLGAPATPAIFYQDDQGRMQMQAGSPKPEQLEAILGRR